MRLDKFLKISRLIKRRSVANEAVGLGRVQLNGKEVKPAHEVKPGDILSLRFGERTLKVRVEEIQPHVLKGDATSLYTILEETK